MDGWADGWMDGWTDGWMDGRMDGWMDGWMDGRAEEIPIGIIIQRVALEMLVFNSGYWLFLLSFITWICDDSPWLLIVGIYLMLACRDNKNRIFKTN